MKSTRRGRFSVHRSEKTPGSKSSSTSGLSPRGHLERQAEFHASTQDEACLSGPQSAGTLRSESEIRGTLRFLPQLEMRPSSNAPSPVESREDPPTISRRNSRKTTWLPRHRKMKPFPATAPQEKSHVRNWRSKGPLAPWMRPTKFPEIPVSLERNTEVFRHPLLGALSPLLIWTGGSTPLLCLEGVPDLPVAPQDEAGLTKTFQTWPRGGFHIP